MPKAFTFKEIKNCRRFLKRCYITSKIIDSELVAKLEAFGFLEIQKFSTFVANAKDTFKIKMLDDIEISGVITGKEMFITISKQNLSAFEQIEQEVENWYSSDKILSK
jgi:hypothetical protein